ncbi:MAG: cupin domain-containing protein [Candidatus Margulisiibacteriota bacterium]|jgi:mannose-6-phosphate isomerase-like protein (cupin superfamily)
MAELSQSFKFKKNFRWQNIPVRKYKTSGTHFKNIVRQTILPDDFPGADFSLRYFEIKAGGHSSLERHKHPHLILVVRGKGKVLIGSEIISVKPMDCLLIASQDWHQFQPVGKEPLGFLCLVHSKRDKPQLPSPKDLKLLQKNKKIAKVIKL